MNEDLEAVLRNFENWSLNYLQADRKYREAKANFIVSQFDPALNTKRKTELEINSLVDGNTELNDLKYERDKTKVYLDIAKVQVDMVRCAYE